MERKKSLSDKGCLMYIAFEAHSSLMFVFGYMGEVIKLFLGA
jgi:hypothetical protein